MSFWSLFGLEALLLVLVFGVAFWACRKLDNYGIVDALWSYSFAGVAVLAASVAVGWGPRKLALLVAVFIWSLRLGTHLAVRIASHHPEEDRRYKALRTLWAGNFIWKMGGFFQAQGAFVLLLSLPLFLAMQNATPFWSPWEIAALAVGLVAWCGEALADAQLRRFKKENAGKRVLCNAGLWRYSRHPNYFFEWLNWVALALAAVSAPYGLWGLLSPVMMLHLLLNVTGIPMTEEQSVLKYGDLYRDYQRTTSAFVPWFKKAP